MSKAPLAVGIFSLLAALIAGAASVTLLRPGTALDAIWGIRQDDVHRQMLALGWPVGTGLAVLSIVAIFIAVGSFRGRRWAWIAAIVALSVNGMADLFRLATGQVVEGMIGFIVAGLIVLALCWPSVRVQFSR